MHACSFAAMAESAHILPGTLDLLILKAVSLGPQHGPGVLLRIEQISGTALVIEQGALYPALYRLEHRSLRASSAPGFSKRKPHWAGDSIQRRT